MKVVLRSSSLAFTLLSIVLNAPVRRVKAENPEPDGSPAEEPRLAPEERGRLASEPVYHLQPRPRL